MDNIFTEIPAQFLLGAQVNLAAQHIAQFVFHVAEGKQTGDMVIFKLHKQVNIAVLPQFAMQSRSEQRDFPYVISTAEIVKPVFRNMFLDKPHGVTKMGNKLSAFSFQQSINS